MKDSARTKQDDSTPPVERPTWRFTGRRGTPVHLREQAPQTLPPEIRKAVTQLARERAGESAPAPDAKPVRAVSNLKLERTDGQAPPVAGAPMPVERRNRRDTSEPMVATSHIPAATAPIAEPSYETASLAEPTFEPAVEQPTAAFEMPPLEAVAEAPAEVEAPVEVEAPAAVEPPAAVEAEAPAAAATEVPEEVDVPVDAPDLVAEGPERTLEPIASDESAPPAETTPVAESAPAIEEPVVKAEPDTADEPPAKAEATKPRPKLSAAERKKLAKAKAKAKAKAERAAKKEADGLAATEKARRLFARGRDVDAKAAAEVEPAVEPDVEPTPVTASTDTKAPAAVTPAAETPAAELPDSEATPASEVPAAQAPEVELSVAEELTVDAPLPPDVFDLPDVIPSLDAIDEAAPLSFPTLEPVAWGDVDAEPEPEPELAVPTSIADVDLGASTAVDAAPSVAQAPELLEPALATESASQAAWELGRLPFLLTDPTPPATETPVEQDVAVWDVTPSTIALPVRTDETFEPAAATIVPSIEPVDEPAPLRASLQPIDWLPVGAQPTPAPIEPIDLPRRTAPDAIQRLGAPLEVPRPDHSLARAGAREGMTANSRTAEARRRIARRRAELDDIVESLAGLGSGRRDG